MSRTRRYDIHPFFALLPSPLLGLLGERGWGGEGYCSVCLSDYCFWSQSLALSYSLEQITEPETSMAIPPLTPNRPNRGEGENNASASLNFVFNINC